MKNLHLIYAWKDDFGLEKMEGSNLNAYNRNPYISTISRKIDIEPVNVQYNDFRYIKIKK